MRLVSQGRAYTLGGHFQPYSQAVASVLGQIESSPYSTRKLGELLLDTVTRGYSTVSTEAEEGVIFLSAQNIGSCPVGVLRRFTTPDSKVKA